MRQALKWSGSSFQTANVCPQEIVIAKNLLPACKCKQIPKAKPQRAQRVKPKRKARDVSEPSSDCDSDWSLIDELAAAMDEFYEAGQQEDVEDSADEEDTDKGKLDKGNATNLSEEKVNDLTKAVSSAKKYSDVGPQASTYSHGGVEASSSSAASSAHPRPTDSFSMSQSNTNENKENLKEMQRFEEAIGSHLVKEALSSIKASGSADSSQALESSIKIAAELNPALTIEEQAEEAVVAVAFASDQQSPDRSARSTAAPPPPPTSSSRLIELWARQLWKTASAFESFLGKFFPDLSSMGWDFHRSISLVQFVEEGVHADAMAASAAPAPEETVCPSFLQFVHWDWPMPQVMRGRKLRIEKGRFVWKPPSRVPSDDDLHLAFQQGWARIVLADVGAALLKARGMFRQVRFRRV